MKFNELIKSYREDKNEKIIDEIKNYMKIDFTKDATRTLVDAGIVENEKTNKRKFKIGRRKVVIELDKPEKYIAYRLNALIQYAYKLETQKTRWQRYMLGANLENTFKHETKNGYTFEEFEDTVYSIRNMYDIEPKEGYKDLLENLDLVKIELGFEYDDFLKEVEYWANEEESFVNAKELISEEIKENEEEILKKINNNAIKALKFALDKVDYSRTNKEIVKFINKLITSKFIKLNYTRNYETVELDIWVLGKSTKYFNKKEINKILTPMQIEFYQKLMKILHTSRIKYRKGNIERMFVPEKRYIAKLMGLSESNFKHRLARIKNRILDYWDKEMERLLKY